MECRRVTLFGLPVAAGDGIAHFGMIYRFVHAQLKRTNGTEFARHARIERQLALQTYVRDPRSPWQKGSVEDAIGHLRRDLPRKTDITVLSQRQLDAILSAHNNTPKKMPRLPTPRRDLQPVAPRM